VEGLVIMERP